MRIKLEKSVVIKLTIIAMIVIAAPFLVPFVTEFLIFADLMGLEALILFLAYQARHAFAETIHRFRVATAHLTKTLVNLSTVYVMQPRVFLTHSIASSVIIIFACSAFLALAIWLPPLYLSLYGSGFI